MVVIAVNKITMALSRWCDNNDDDNNDDDDKDTY